MRQTEFTGKAQTVLGAIDANLLGVTLSHEHLLLDQLANRVEPSQATERELAYQPVTLDNLGWVRAHQFSSVDNLRLTDESLAIKEALRYKWAGGNTIVELSTSGLFGDPLGLARIARATSLNVIMGTGYYVGASHPPELATKTEEEIGQEIVRDIIVGIGDTGVRAGIIGEIGCSSPLVDSERKVLRACAIAQQRTGAAINIHPGSSDDSPLEIISILGDAGADLSRTVISHVDLWGFSLNTCRILADAGCYLECDTFGHLGLPQLAHRRLLDVPSDTQRINKIIEFIGEGYINQILVGHDVSFKHTLTAYGGYGYAHILDNIVPLMRVKGISNEQIHALLVENPKRILRFAPAQG